MSNFTFDISPKMNSNAAPTSFIFQPVTPSSFNFKSDDPSKNSEFKFGQKKSGLFLFGDQNPNVDKKNESGFNFVFGQTTTSGSPEITSNSETLKITPILEKESDSKNLTEPALLNISEESHKETNCDKKSEDTIEKDLHKSKQEINEEKENSSEDISVKALLKEFKELVNGFVKERVDNEKRIIVLEEKLEALQKEVEELKNVKHKNSENTIDKSADTSNIAQSAITTKTTHLSTLNSRPTIFGTASTFGSNTPSTNFLFGGTVFPSTWNQASAPNQLFSRSTGFRPPPSMGGFLTIPCMSESETKGTSTNIGLLSSSSNTGTNKNIFSSSSKTLDSSDTVANKRNRFLNTLDKVDNEFMKKSEIKIGKESQQNQISTKIDDSLVIQLKESLEESLKNTVKDIFKEFKKSFENELGTRK